MSRAPRILEAGVAAFAATTGAILAFGHARGGALLPFVRIGRRVLRDVQVPVIGDAGAGLIVHLGQSLALGALAVFLTYSPKPAARFRAALLTVVLWHLSALIPWFAAIRADASLNLSKPARFGLAALLTAALVLGSRTRNAQEAREDELND